jgi:hypothetical protein
VIDMFGQEIALVAMAIALLLGFCVLAAAWPLD